MDLPVNLDVYNSLLTVEGDLCIKLRPRSYRDINAQNLEVFENQRIVSIVNDDTMDAEVKQQRFNEVFKKITNLTLANVIGSIEFIKVGEETINNRKVISDFLKNADIKIYKMISDYHDKSLNAVPEKKIFTQCPECGHEYETPFTFDQSNFFALAS